MSSQLPFRDLTPHLFHYRTLNQDSRESGGKVGEDTGRNGVGGVEERSVRVL